MFLDSIMLITMMFGLSSQCINTNKDTIDVEEISELRTDKSLTFKTNKETFRTYYFQNSVCFNNNGSMEFVDTSFEQAFGDVVTKNNSHIVSLNGSFLSLDEIVLFPTISRNKLISYSDNFIEFEHNRIFSNPDSLVLESDCCLKDNSYTLTFRLTDECLKIERRESAYCIIDESGMVFYEFSIPFIRFSSSESIAFPADSKANNTPDAFEITYRFADDLPTTLAVIHQEILYSSYYNGNIQNKYFEVGYAATYTGSTIPVGKAEGFLNQNGETPIYKSVFNLTIPSYSLTQYIILDSYFSVRKSSGNLSVVNISKTSGISYENINGTATYSSSLLDVVTLSSNRFKLNLTQEIVDDLSAGVSSINLIYSSSLSQIAYLYSITSSIFTPYFTIEYDYCGYICGDNAPTSYYLDNNFPYANCFALTILQNEFDNRTGYLLSQNLGSNEIVTSTVMKNKIYNYVISVAYGQCGYSTRLLDNYNSAIYSTERRICFRLKLNSSYCYDGDYHYACQCNDWSWSYKTGSGGLYYNFAGDSAPTTSGFWPASYNGPVIYFAIS